MSYSPSLAIVTAILEIASAGWALSGSDRRPASRTTSAILLLLAAYQIIEVLVCARVPAAGFAPRLAFIVVTWLPPLGLLLIAQLSLSFAKLNHGAAYAMLAAALGIVIWIGVDARFVTDSVCTVVYAKYANPLPRFLAYAWFYWIGLFGMVALSGHEIIRTRPRRNRPLEALLMGSLGFIVPAVICTHFVAPAQGALPSVMCHFALILAVSLVFVVRAERRYTHASSSPDDGPYGIPRLQPVGLQIRRLFSDRSRGE